MVEKVTTDNRTTVIGKETGTSIECFRQAEKISKPEE